MNFDHLLTGIIFMAVFFVLFALGKVVYNLLHRDFDLNREMVENDNPAVSLAVTGYYAGLVLAIGAAIVGPSAGFTADLMDLLIYGVLSIVLLNISSFVCDWLILFKFKISDELLRDRNQGTGAVVFGTLVASGFVIFGSVSGAGGTIWTAMGFWALGQVLLIVAALVYNFILPFDLHQEIERDNVAAGVAFAGALIAMGVVVGLAAEGDFVSWGESLPSFLAYALLGLVSLPFLRLLTDRLLLPGVKLSDEIVGIRPDHSKEERGPNVGAAYVEAFAYIAGAYIIYWCI
ncbi:conserved hypothetical protein [Desulforapulum autotrophicum HRM2]|uniref:DUF350 domain-containing protein n=1 Tax=Desulforapulum autotrophicum (strain ATCC 43914 / DSM 3382 / VKM B-1955 / HRM2) TaxID=177437 RepID=C0QK85_DESAH|nr:DUF350 domain-containing protein [Desulforapulum autotrophicum]ACN16111.1 conserved hypothetical protein [Desulforapulum autotrophicum HRM2]